MMNFASADGSFDAITLIAFFFCATSSIKCSFCSPTIGASYIIGYTLLALSVIVGKSRTSKMFNRESVEGI